MYKKPTGLLKDVMQKRIKGKSTFLRRLEAEQKARAALDANPPRCSTHQQFEYDCLECGEALEKDSRVAVLRAGYTKRRSVK